MDCDQIRELLPDLAAGMNDISTPEVSQHVASCSDCTAHLHELRATMALLDEWQAPEPSAYFDTRLQARMREEMARPAAGWFHWLRTPAWSVSISMSLAAVLFAGALAIGVSNKSYFAPLETIAVNPPTPGLPVQPGTAVGDLQALEKNDALYADFDVLDELQVQDDVTANP